MLRLCTRSLITQVRPALTKMAPVETPKVIGRMFSIQASLPRFPVAPLDQTMDKYMRSVRPLLTDEEYQQTQKLCEEFQNGVGPKLNSKLQERAAKTTNWLSEWWKHLAYLDFRSPCPINSNPGVLFPKADYKGVEGQLLYASRLLAGMLSYKVMIDNQTLPVEHLGKNPLCMAQYFQILSACRVPGIKHDDWFCFPPDKPGAPTHITVICNNNFFSMEVYGTDHKPLNAHQLHRQLQQVVNMSADKGPPVGILTMEHRNNWGKIYKHMCKDATNRHSLENIQRSILVLCLDQPAPETDDPRTVGGAQMLHGVGSTVNSANRWFDKTIQFIVGTDGYSGLNYEHTTAEGPPVIHLMDSCLQFIESGQNYLPADGAQVPMKLEFNLKANLLAEIHHSATSTDTFINDVDLKLMIFDDFGKNFPKGQKVSPDSFIQTAIQLAYYRLHKKPCGSYESASIRMFQHGRTETIRSCSNESLAFTQAMFDPESTNQKRAELIRKAIISHKQYTNDAVSGKGIDRHLLGLKLIALENNMPVPELHMDHAFSVSGYWKVSTSQVPARSPSVLFFGPVVPDGYGICYNPQEKEILFGVSSFKHNNETVTATEMANSIRASLFEMKDVLASTMKANL